MRTNTPFMYYLAFISSVLVLLLLVVDNDVISKVFSLQKGVPILFRFVLLLMVVLNGIVALACEWILVDKIIRERQLRKEMGDMSKLVPTSRLASSPTRHYYGISSADQESKKFSF